MTTCAASPRTLRVPVEMSTCAASPRTLRVPVEMSTCAASPRTLRVPVEMYVPWLPIWVQDDDDDFSSEFSINEKSSKNRDFWDRHIKKKFKKRKYKIQKSMIRKWRSRIEINCKTTMVLNRILYGMPIKRENYICKMKNCKKSIKKNIYHRSIKVL